jgi:signal transduction histidine kinase
LYDPGTIVKIYSQLFDNAKHMWNFYADTKSLTVPFAIKEVSKTLSDAKDRGVNFRFVTEITRGNLTFCKNSVMKVAEVRHLGGIKGNFGVSDTEYISTSDKEQTTANEEEEAATTAAKTTSSLASLQHAVYSNVKEDIQQQQHIFEILWTNAIPAEERIREIEEGLERVETVALKDSAEIAKRIRKNIESSTELKICSQPGGLELIYNNFFESYKEVLDNHRRGRNKGIRWITTINKDNEGVAKLLLNEGVQLRHTKNLTPLSFSISNKEFQATAEKMEAGKMIKNMLVSTDPIYIDHYNSIFEQLWENSIDARDRIYDIKEGVDLSDIEVIPRSARTRVLYLELVKNAKEEILFIFPTSRAFIRQEKMGAIPAAIKAAQERAVKVRILVPYNEAVEDRLKPIMEEEELVPRKKERELRRANYNADIDVRYIEEASGTLATILVVDRRASLVMELRDDSKTTFDGAIGLSTYSNSKAGVLSYVGIFEKLWKQIELYQQVSDAHERLKLHGRMQQEFINIAAHELRTPIQPIISTVGLLSSADHAMISRDELNHSINMIARNATRLKQLSEDILDVTRIESQTLNLRKEVYDLNEMVQDSIEDYKRNPAIRPSKEIKIESISHEDKIFVEVDRARISQVIFNLLSNAFKFTKEGGIVVSIGLDQKNNKEAVISVKDSGKGIDPEIFPKLFEKFASKSYQGTGLGLFISRSIIEAHGGSMYAKNNSDDDGRRGATFYFSLPVVHEREQQK